MTEKTRIGILGIGAVGGYFGGLLAQKYSHSEKVEVIFITRPAAEKIIKEKGLRLITLHNEKIIFPGTVTSNPNDVGLFDYLICAIKSYDLEDSLIPLKNSITDKTIILPLLNGVDAKERINKLYPSAEVLDGCVYIVSRLISPGVIKETGNIHELHFGSNSVSSKKLKQLEQLFFDANIDCILSNNIEQTIWEKFLFISSLASLTSYLNLTSGAITENQTHKQTLIKLITELKLIADAKGIQLSENIIEKTLSRIEKLPYETTSSMHSDFQKGGKTEYVSLTEYVTKQGQKLGIKTPTFDTILKKFIEIKK